jgi:hypothetical protein
MHVGRIVCDLANAFFDCINHAIVLVKLEFCGNQCVGNQFRSYLANRKQKAEIKLSNASQNCFSYFGILKKGATQERVYSRAFNVHNIHICLSHERTHNICMTVMS